VSSATNESVVVVFYESTTTGFIGGIDTSPISVSLTGTFANGTAFSIVIPADLTASAVITADANETSGNWESTGFMFEGTTTSALTQYTVSIDNADYGVLGTVTLYSVSRCR
jgi:hypothetical protein